MKVYKRSTNPKQQLSSVQIQSLFPLLPRVPFDLLDSEKFRVRVDVNNGNGKVTRS